MRIERFQRESNGSWRYRLLEAGEVLVLANGATLGLDALYENAFDLAAD